MTSRESGRAEIRFAGTEDLDWLLSEFGVADSPQGKRALERHIQYRQVLVAELDGRPVGCLRFQYIWSRLPFIANIFISPAEFRGRGIGTRMLALLEDHLRGQGHSKLVSSSETVSAESQDWHRKAGFRDIGTLNQINEGDVGEVFFMKDLVEPKDG